jgi:hypothetical protein
VNDNKTHGRLAYDIPGTPTLGSEVKHNRRDRYSAAHHRWINLWRYGILFLPDFALLLVIAGLGMRRLLRYLDAKGRPS